jgi:glucokinase
VSGPPPGAAVVAVDVGGSSMKGAVVGHDGTILAMDTRPTAAERGPAAVVDDIVGFAAGLSEAGQRRTGASPVAAGIAVPCLVDEVTGVAAYSANIGWRDVPIGDLATRRLDRPVAIGHDVRTGGLAESRLGAGRNAADFLFLPIGTGIAGAVVLRGAPYPGDRGWAGELGHIPVWPDGEPCACGNRGCLETYASAAAIARRYSGAPGLDAEDVLARAAAGDPDAVRVWDEAVEALAIGLAAYILTLDPALVVIGGGLAEAGTRLLAPLRGRLATRLAWRDPPRIEAARLGPRATTLGAALLGWRAAGHPDAGGDW